MSKKDRETNASTQENAAEFVATAQSTAYEPPVINGVCMYLGPTVMGIVTGEIHENININNVLALRKKYPEADKLFIPVDSPIIATAAKAIHQKGTVWNSRYNKLRDKAAADRPVAELKEIKLS